jgi:hypothetical protein
MVLPNRYFSSANLHQISSTTCALWLAGNVGARRGRAISEIQQCRHNREVFTSLIASFETEGQALAYSQPHWEPEPGEKASDEEYQAWEDRNPLWPMKRELGGAYLDEDFIETIWAIDDGLTGPDWKYLSGRLEAADVEACKAIAPSRGSTLILIDEQASDGLDFKPSSTPAMIYCGTYRQRS